MKVVSGIGERMRHAREAQGMSQTKLADLLRYSKYHLSNVEHGRAKPSQELLAGYERVLGLEPGALLWQDAFAASRSAIEAPTALTAQEQLRASVITSALEDSVPEVREAAIQTLGMWQGADVDAALARLVRDPDAAIRLAAMRIVQAHVTLGTLPSAPTVAQSPMPSSQPAAAQPAAAPTPPASPPVAVAAPVARYVAKDYGVNALLNPAQAAVEAVALRHTSKPPKEFLNLPWVILFDKIAKVKPNLIYAKLLAYPNVRAWQLECEDFFPSLAQLQYLFREFKLTSDVEAHLNEALYEYAASQQDKAARDAASPTSLLSQREEIDPKDGGIGTFSAPTDQKPDDHHGDHDDCDQQTARLTSGR
jgi:transcriptional regulator with XRE-family HTH domain